MKSNCKTCGIGVAPKRERNVRIYCSVACRNADKVIPAEQRFWRFVKKSDDCWIFDGCISSYGYGLFGRMRAHRFSFQLANGPIPNGLFVCHRCDNRACVRPEHLFLGTHAENMRDMVAKGRQSRGESRGAKLSREQVLEIRSSRLGARTLAKRFGVGRSTVVHVRKGESFAWVVQR